MQGLLNASNIKVLMIRAGQSNLKSQLTLKLQNRITEIVSYKKLSSTAIYYLQKFIQELRAMRPPQVYDDS